jgi:hypothetical protein
MFECRSSAMSSRGEQTRAGGPIERVVRHRQGSLNRNEAGISHLRTSETRDLVDEVISLHLPARDGYCDPAEHDVVQGARGVEPGLALHRRSALFVGWSSLVRQLFHFVTNIPYHMEINDVCTSTTERISARSSRRSRTAPRTEP